MFTIHSRPGSVVGLVALVVSAAALAACAAVPAASPPATPASIDPPQGERAMTLTASGVQIYACEYDAQHRLGWVFKQPQATLYDASGHAALRHGAGPSWEADDGSRIVGHVLAQRPSDTAASVPQLLLETHSTGGSGVLSTVRYVQRVRTVGGTMPAAPCSAQGELGSSPYLANYVFYR
ncbi:DUF3455 domain-containing protein [Paraburkholderia sp. D15]|uniref:DUF3455 domain-containing protein n=1 Tax=Paraburkholderia sp. D15 TaxID=2880218 RepID=UPI00247988E0|nr:DUF3455 domain-containing protein [Paraburkholderia sp. D15]WGS52516.1 DUF3455 domain-containing protein [Paraburkholderia sp. D15]